MTDWTSLTNWGMAIPSLFPGLGLIQKLDGFYPPGFRKWFTLLATVFSLLVYLQVQWSFENLPLFVPVWVGAITALCCLVAYVVIHLAMGGKYQGLAGFKKGFSIMGLMLLYFGFVSSLTYSFNALENLREYSVICGRVLIGSPPRPAGLVQVTLGFDSGFEGIRSQSSGRFEVIVPRTKLAGLTSVRFSKDVDDQRYGLTLTRQEITQLGNKCEDWQLERLGGSP